MKQVFWCNSSFNIWKFMYYKVKINYNQKQENDTFLFFQVFTLRKLVFVSEEEESMQIPFFQFIYICWRVTVVTQSNRQAFDWTTTFTTLTMITSVYLVILHILCCFLAGKDTFCWTFKLTKQKVIELKS